MNEKVPAGWIFATHDKAEGMPTPTQQTDPELKQVTKAVMSRITVAIASQPLWAGFQLRFVFIHTN